MWIYPCVAASLLPSHWLSLSVNDPWRYEYYTLAAGHKECMTSRIRRTTSSRMWCSSGRGDMYWKKPLISSWSLQKNKEFPLLIFFIPLIVRTYMICMNAFMHLKKVKENEYRPTHFNFKRIKIHHWNTALQQYRPSFVLKWCKSCISSDDIFYCYL